jgi:hypothetical protein
VRPTEVVGLTRYIRAHFPHQPIDEFTTEALEETLTDFPLTDCRAAVLNLAERGEEWCQPTAVKAEVKRIRAKRIADYGPIEPPAGLDVLGYQRWLGNMTRAIADGSLTSPPEIDMGDGRDVIAELGHVGREVPRD